MSEQIAQGKKSLLSESGALQELYIHWGFEGKEGLAPGTGGGKITP